ncbi:MULTISPECIES: class I SAM-dependent methyltransferase [unclassified Pseudodesulfovibrio]|uniref:class I SAM-dependent methyltransferase n=1 Tax=unclassified Pseudodesulfovibrio TaxID=2661612 RepID=UPI000FEBEE3C|nr:MULTISPECIES: class I SAM-dependent methyltransferase [unclassified Pseudodesulfovibrio]MCJ2164132.1 class I SAM-dependent methyltransferase [Pseudodesulfovibrio sp. S3-i]RWU05239.1 methyltransferase domain-containing protein [Pseudodesulfovibrio sp. S3]
MKDFYTRTDCRLCRSESLETVLEIGSTPVGDDFVTAENSIRHQPTFPLELSVCRNCGLLQLPGVINPELIYSDYLYETSASLGLEEHFINYAKRMVDKVQPKADALVVDIGSNVGCLLHGVKSLGYSVLGIEPASALAKKATDSGVETWPMFFNRETACMIKREKEPAGIITANNVFANIDDLTDMMEGIAELLDHDGVFVFETGYMLDTVQNTVIDNVYHEHLCYFSVLPLIPFFYSHGLELVDVERIPTKGGSIRGMVQRKGGPRVVAESVTGLANLERELGFEGMAPFSNFVKRVEEMKRELLALIDDLRAQGKTVAGYGASVGVTTMLYYLDLKDRLDCLYDDNPVKFGTFSPGLHIPVHDSSKIYEHRPDYILNIAWRYANPIMNRHEAYLENGGQFISMLPVVSIINREDR